MGDIETDIQLKSSGGDQAAADIDKATSALNRTSQSSKNMEGVFQHKFQHLGLMLFAGDALRASGLGSETRMVVNLLNTALIEGAAAGGFASGGLLLVVSAMAAFVGIAEKVTQHQKDHIDLLVKEADANDKAMKAADDQVQAVDDYQEAGARLTPTLIELKNANQTLAESLKQDQLAVYQQLIMALNQKIAFEVQDTAIMAGLERAALAVDNAHLSVLATMTKIGLFLTGHGWVKDAADVKAHTDALKKDEAELANVQQKMADILKGQSFKQEAQEAIKAADDIEQRREKMLENMSAGAQVERDTYIKLHADIAKDHDEMLKKQQEQLKQHQAVVKHVADQIGSDFGNAFAKMIVEGKSFTDEMKAAFQNMAEQIISDLIRIIVEQQLLFMWQSMTGTTGSGNLVGGGGGSGGGGMFGGLFATGGSVVANSPTVAVFGEAGPEMATFTPLSSAGMDVAGAPGRGGGIVIGSVNTTIQGVQDPNAIANEVGLRIIQQIRGMGQLDFTR